MNTKQIILNIESRDKLEKNSDLRNAGLTPAVFYGPEEDITSLIKVVTTDLEKMWKLAGENTIITLRNAGGLDDKEVVIKDIQWDPIYDTPVHADFYVIKRGQEMNVNVPLEFVGEAPAEKLGGNVSKAFHEIEIEAKPKDIPQNIVVDLTKLETLESVITIADLSLPKDVTAINNSDDVVASIVVTKEEQDENKEETGDAPVDDNGTE